MQKNIVGLNFLILVIILYNAFILKWQFKTSKWQILCKYWNYYSRSVEFGVEWVFYTAELWTWEEHHYTHTPKYIHHRPLSWSSLLTVLKVCMVECVLAVSVAAVMPMDLSRKWSLILFFAKLMAWARAAQWETGSRTVRQIGQNANPKLSIIIRKIISFMVFLLGFFIAALCI